MTTYAGTLLLPDGPVEGYVQVDGGRVVARGRGESPEPAAATGWIVPGLVNAHTHVADSFLRNRLDKPRDVAELVGPGGWKHQQLAAATPEAMAGGIVHVTDEMAAIGTGHFIDFREGGLEGANLLNGLRRDLAVEPVIMGRPAKNNYDENEAAQLLLACHGIGLSGVRDFPKQRHIMDWAEACHQARKPFAIHVSEDRRDDIDFVASLEPTFVVHMVKGTDSDFDELAQQRIPVVVCPRSNDFFGAKPPVDRMLEAGVTVAVGTDNGMLADGNVLAELAQLRAWFPAIETDALLRMASYNGRALAGAGKTFPQKGDEADLVVLPEQPIMRVEPRKPGLGIAP